MEVTINSAEKNIEDIYPLSPLQEGMLFHTLFDSESGAYFEQVGFTIRADLNVSNLEQAWLRAVERHPVLRTAFVWEGLKKPLQVVQRKVTFSLQLLDWRDMSAEEHGSRLDDYLRAERRQGFQLSKAPLMRLTLITLSDDAYHFIWSHHHILLDGWSVNLLLKEVSSIYSCLSQDEKISLPRSRPYKDYIRWQQQQDLASAETFWRGMLKEFTSPTPLPAAQINNKRFKPEQSHGIYEIEVAEKVRIALQNLARQQGLTLNTIVQGAWGLLLARYSGSSDVVFGATVSGRPAELAGVETMIGLFINTLPVRVEVDESEDVISWLKQLQQQQVEAQQYQYSPLVDIQSWSQVPGGQPLFESLLVIENYPLSSPPLQESRSGSHYQERDVGGVHAFERTHYPLNILVVPHPVLALRSYFDRNRYDDDGIYRLLCHLQELLRQIAADSQRPVGTLGLLTESERRQMLEEWNETGAEYPRMCIQEIYEQQARQSPEAVAVSSQGQSVTYAELNERANQIAHYLMRKGIGAESRVGICVERGIDMVAGLLGILKAGAAYVPLDPEYPRHRLTYMMDDSGVEIVITQSSLLEVITSDGVEGVCLDREWAEIASQPTINPDVKVEADNLAYVIYTSGSTGLPKGVAIQHNSASAFLHWAAQEFGQLLGSVLATTSVCFDLSVFEIFAPLSVGGKVVVSQGPLAVTAEEAGEVRLINTVPSAIEEMARGGRIGAGVRGVNLAGEALRRRIVEQVYGESSVEEVRNLYGPSEYTTYATMREEKRGEEGEPLIGRPITNTQVYVLDGEKRPVPVGVAGELYISGAGLARGYINKADQTAERFLPNPYSEEGGGRMYRTGDVCRYREGGEIEYIGRADNQVKVRGYRIELGEVEAALMRREGVRQAVVVVREEEQAGKRLVAYVVEEERSEVMWAEMRQELKQELPEYMVPTAYVKIDKMPLTPNGKVDRQALPEEGREEARSSYSVPRSAEEEIIAGIWEEVLGVEKVGMDDNFFELGGHSLLATRVISRVRETLDVEIGVRELFEAETVRGLAGRVREARSEQRGSVRPAIKRAGRDRDFPLSFAQQRIWFIDQLMPGHPSYNIPATLPLLGPINLTAFELSINEIIKRHEILRTSFAKVEGQPVQIIAPILLLEIPVIDLMQLPDSDRGKAAQRLATEEGHRPFDLSQGPLLRVRLLRLGDQEHVLLLTMHHIITDAWSVMIFIRELTFLYESFLSQSAPQLPDLPIQYADFALWQREWLQGEALEEQLTYWRKKLEGAPAILELPTDRPRPPVLTFSGATESFSIPAALSDSLRGLCRRERITLFMALLAAFQTLLYRYTGQEDIVVSSGVANRNSPMTEPLIGCLINILLLRTDLSGNPTFRDLLRRVREITLDAHAHQDLPFEKLIEALNPERDLSHQPLFQVMFVLQNAQTEGHARPDARQGAASQDLGLDAPTTVWTATQCDLMLHMWESDEGISGFLQYNTDLFFKTTITRLLTHFETLLESIVADPGERISTLRLLTEAETRCLLVEWNDTEIHFPGDTSLHSLFEAQVEQAPDALALLFGDGQIEYGELNRRANQLARHLIDLGVRPDSVVGVFLDRSPELAVAILGVLKAGGAYVPLDPDYPAQRLEFILEDSRASLTITKDALIDRLPGGNTQLLCIDSDRELFIGRSDANTDVDVSADNLAYLIYSSGTTGVPKAIAIRHGGVVNNINDLNNRFTVGPGDRILALSSPSFDMSVYEILGSLAAGAAVVMARESGSRDPAHWVELMLRHNVTVWNSAPALLEAAVNYLDNHTDTRPRSLRLVLLGGDWVPLTLPDRLKAMIEGVHVIVMGGATEASIHSIIYPVDETDPSWKSIPYGRPMANQKSYILDRQLQLVPAGMPGELHIGGVGLARGYFDRPDLTAEKFIPNAFARRAGDRLYKTGDLARQLPDGNIELLGRMDFQVKLRGFRIDLGEVEAALRTHPAVQDAVAVVREDHPGDRRLAAYAVLNSAVLNGDAVPAINRLRNFLKKRLPDYMVPSVFITLESLPLSPNGKVDRRALPIPASARPDLEKAFTPPDTPVEQVVAGIWREILEVDEVGIHDNFFELGGHSLLAMRVVSRLEEAFQMAVPLRCIFESPTVAELAQSLEAEADASQINLPRVAQILIYLDRLSEAEVEAMLAEKSGVNIQTGSEQS